MQSQACTGRVKITLFSFCKSEGDEDAAKAIIKELPQDVDVNCVNYDGNLKGFLRKYREMETVVTLRFHSLVLSLVMGQKICPLIYSNKISNLLSDIKYEDFSATLSEIADVDIASEIKAAKKADDSLPELSQKAGAQFCDFERLFLNA